VTISTTQSNRLTFVAVEHLKEHEFKSAEKTAEVLFQGFLPRNIGYDPVLKMAAEYFTHLGIACKQISDPFKLLMRPT